jgi:hypothetical protein
MRITNKQDHCVLKYDAVYFDAAKEFTATVQVLKTSKFNPD